MKTNELKKVLDEHKQWLTDSSKGKKANLRGANLREANLRGADLREADLQRADLREANLDFSCFPLWCGSFDMKVDDRVVWQLVAHIGRLNTNNCSTTVKRLINILKPF